MKQILQIPRVKTLRLKTTENSVVLLVKLSFSPQISAFFTVANKMLR